MPKKRDVNSACLDFVMFLCDTMCKGVLYYAISELLTVYLWVPFCV